MLDGFGKLVGDKAAAHGAKDVLAGGWPGLAWAQAQMSQGA